jgi:hypothetical protein
MNNLLRKLRGIAGTAATWAAGWGALFGALWAGFGAPLAVVAQGVMAGGFLGACAGASFATILSIAERQRTLQQLSLKRVALWGGLGGVALLLALSPLRIIGLLSIGAPLRVIFSLLVPMGISGILGTVFATGSVVIARRDDRKQIEAELGREALGTGSQR